MDMDDVSGGRYRKYDAVCMLRETGVWTPFLYLDRNVPIGESSCTQMDAKNSVVSALLFSPQRSFLEEMPAMKEKF